MYFKNISLKGKSIGFLCPILNFTNWGMDMITRDFLVAVILDFEDKPTVETANSGLGRTLVSENYEEFQFGWMQKKKKKNVALYSSKALFSSLQFVADIFGTLFHIFTLSLNLPTALLK